VTYEIDCESDYERRVVVWKRRWQRYATAECSE
jgi:hypothetical protein